MTDKKYQVLIFDDDRALSEVMRDFLVSTCNSQVMLVHFEEDFWRVVKNTPYDILFLDYRLHDTTGLEILAAMSNQGISIPTVMMTGEGNEKIATQAIQSGAFDYLVKGDYPFSVLPQLVSKAVQIREFQKAIDRSLEQIRYQAMLLNNVQDAVIVWEKDGKITYWNKAAENLYGKTAETMLGQSVYSAFGQALTPPIVQPDPNAATIQQVERKLTQVDGQVVWVSSHINILYGGKTGEDFLGYMDVSRDITRSKAEQEALSQSRYLIQRILDASPNIIYTLKLQSFQINYISPQAEDVLGVAVEQLIQSTSNTFQAFAHPEDWGKIEKHYQNAVSMVDGEYREFEFRFRHPAFGWRWLKIREMVFSRSADGKVAELIGVGEDITRHKLSDERLISLLKSEKLISTISSEFISSTQPGNDFNEALKTISIFIDADFAAVHLPKEDYLIQPYQYSGPGLYGIRRATRPLKLSRALFNPLFDLNTALIEPEVYWQADHPNNQNSTYRMLLTDGIQSAIIFPLVYNNAVRGLLVFGSKKSDLQWTQGQNYLLRTFVSVLLKALIQKEVDQALLQSEARYRAIVEEHQTEMICRFLPNATLTFVNEAYCQYYGESREQLIGTSFLEWIHPQDQEAVLSAIARMDQENLVERLIVQATLIDGQSCWQEWAIRAIPDPTQQSFEYQAVGHDITEQKILEEQIQAAQSQLAQSARLSSIGKLASSVAHQISNPLTTIIADGQYLLHLMKNDQDMREAADAIVKAGWRAQRVIEELMKFSEPSRSVFENISLNETIQVAVLLTGSHLQAAGIQLTLELPEISQEISGNPQQLTDLWVNLLLNRSSDPDNHPKRIWIKMEDLPEKIIVKVMDDGTSIPEDQAESIFEPQLIPTSASHGTGIELSLCREIARQHNGTIIVSSHEGLTTFEIVLPRR